MKYINYEEILSTLQKRRQENSYLSDKRKEEVYNAIPRIEKIDDEIAAKSLAAARKRLLMEPVDMNKLREETKLLMAEKAGLLTERGYPEDYLMPVYTCSLCQDTGYINEKPCTCMQQMVISQLYEQSTLQDILERENFNTFSLKYYSRENDGIHKYTPYENMCNALEKSKAFVRNFDNRKNGILIYGETGLGKTFLSNCIAKALLDKGHTVLYLSSISLFDDILSNVLINRSNEKSKLILYDYLCNCEMLVIDDLGTEYPNSFVQSQLFEIINSRTNKRLSTLISTNLSMSELQGRYTERIMSRIIADFMAINIYGDNIRYAKRKEQIKNQLT